MSLKRNFHDAKKIYEQKIKWLKELKKVKYDLRKKRMGIRGKEQ
jgi:hypothetical protein